MGSSTTASATATASATSTDDAAAATASASSADSGLIDLSLSLGISGDVSAGISTSTSAPAAASGATSSAGAAATSASSSTASTDKHVFAHFMVGVVSTYAQGDWESDMTLASSKGIDAFALNIGVDDYTTAQLDLAYAAAAAVGFSVFISFDFNWYTTDNTTGVATILQAYMGESAQLKVDGKPFVSTFIGDSDTFWSTVATAVGAELYAVPYYTTDYASNAGLAGLFSWYAWPGQTNNQPVNASMTMDNDQTYLDALGDKPYMAPVSPWFFTHFGAEVSYSKNFLFKSETLWKDRWDQILSMGSKLNFIEIITWNDYGESHYIGPYDTPHTDDGSSKWAEGFDHTPMMDFMEPYITAYKSGATSPVVTTERLVYWHRPHLKSASCDSTDNCGSPPTGYEYVSDSVFVATMTKSGGSFTVTSGSNSQFQQTVDAGIQIFEVPMATGTQSLTFTTPSGSSSGTSNITVSADCWNGIYNFNYHSAALVIS